MKRKRVDMAILCISALLAGASVGLLLQFTR